jgi:2-methylcitrate dehydratase PrpD
MALAEAGISGPRPVFDGKFGWFRSHVQGRDDFRFEAVTAELGTRWEVMNIASKVYPCAFTMMPHIECALILRERHGIRPEEIAQVICRIGRRSFATVCEPVADKRRPATTWHGRISLQHTVAEALVRGRMDKHAYAEANLRDPVINAVADLVLHEDDPTTTTTRSGGTVILCMKDGRELAHRIDDMRGTSANPMTREDIVAKFMANVQDLLPPARADQAVESLLSLERVEDVAPVLDSLSG